MKGTDSALTFSQK